MLLRLEVAADRLVDLHVVLLAQMEWLARGGVLVDVLGAEAVDRVGGEPAARLRGGQLGERELLLALLILRRALAAHGHDVDQDEGLHDAVGDEGAAAGEEHDVALQAVLDEGVAVVLEDEAACHQAHARNEERLGPPVYVHARDDASRDVAQDLPVVERVDVRVRASHAEEEHPCVAAREVEDQNAKDHVEDEIRITAHVQRDACHVFLRRAALELRVRADDHPADGERQGDRHDGLDEERDQERGREGVRFAVLGERALHGVGLELLGEGVDIRKPLAEVGAEAQARHDQVRGVVGRGEVQRNVEHARDRVQDHVASLAIILEAEAHSVGDARADFVHDGVTDHDDHGEGKADQGAGLATVLVVEIHHVVGVWGVEHDCPEEAGQDDAAKTDAQAHDLRTRGGVAEVHPLNGVGLGVQLDELHGLALDLQGVGAQRFDDLVAEGLRVEDDERVPAGVDLRQHRGQVRLLLLGLLVAGEHRLLLLEQPKAMAAVDLLARRQGRLLPVEVVQVLVEGLLDQLLLLLVVPSNGDTHNLRDGNAALGGDGLLEVLLEVLTAADGGHSLDHGDVVLHGLVLEVNGLERPELAHAVEEVHYPAADVDDDEEQHLGPHEPLLGLVAPGDEDAVLAGRAEATGAEDQEGPVDAEDHAQPARADEAGPDDEPRLEVEVQDHARAGDHRAAEVRAEGPELAPALLVWGLPELLPLAELHGLIEALLVRGRADRHVEDPDQDGDHDAGDDAQDRVERHVILPDAEAVHEVVADLALVAVVVALRGVALVAAVHEARPADAHGRVADGRLRVHGGALRLLDAAERTEGVVRLVLGVELAVVRAGSLLVGRGVGLHGLAALGRADVQLLLLVLLLAHLILLGCVAASAADADGLRGQLSEALLSAQLGAELGGEQGVGLDLRLRAEADAQRAVRRMGGHAARPDEQGGYDCCIYQERCHVVSQAKRDVAG
mmetsp:Transcript_71106/g.186469  ORF Transcript_71106/g.186469 Transcript_71106/m.186469 type:complete len:959 (+) Transcript_71106:213-3089(+)